MNNVTLVLTLTIILGAGVPLTGCTRTVVHNSLSLHGGIIKQANGLTTETIKLKDVKNRRLETEVKLEVERGNVRLELLDNKGQPTVSITSTPRQTVLGKGYLVADASGLIKYRITAIEAENINYSLTINH